MSIDAYSLSRQQATSLMAEKLVQIQSLIDDCIDLGEVHNIEFAFEVGRTTVQRTLYGEVLAWESSTEPEWTSSSDWINSNC